MDNIWSKRSNGFLQDLLKATEFELQNAPLQSEQAEVATPEMDIMDTNSNIKISVGEKLNSLEYKKRNQRQINVEDSSKGSLIGTPNLFTTFNELESEHLEINNLEKQIYSEDVSMVLKAFPHTSKKRKIDDTIKEKLIEDTKRCKMEHIVNGISEDGHTIETEEICESEDEFENLTLTHSPFFLILDIPGISCGREDNVNKFSEDKLPRNERESEDAIKNNDSDSSFLYNEKEAEEPPDYISDREGKSSSSGFIREFPEFSNEVLPHSKNCVAYEGTMSIPAESELFSDIKESPESIKNNFKSEEILSISCIEALKHQFNFNELILKCYECHICFEEFKYSKILVQHIKCHDIDKFQCTVCDYCSIDVLEFYRHRAAHTNTKPFTCNLCNYETVLMEELTEHVVLHYEKTYECNMCYFTSVLKEEFDEHIKTHDNEIDLEEHRSLIDDSLQFQEHILWQFINSPYKDVSQLSGNLKNDANRHTSHPLSISNQTLNAVRPKNKSGKITLNMGTSPNKMSRFCAQSSSSNILNCNSCDYKCNKKAHLDMHMITHTGDRQYKCTLCDYSCRQKQNLNRHMQKHTDVKSLNCTECDFQSYNEFNLQRHMVTHIKEKSYKSKKCNYYSDHKSDLKTHLMFHNSSTKNELLFRCEECSLLYNSDIDLKFHRINHCKSRFFKYEECDYKSIQNNDVVKHVKKHSNQLICKVNYENLQTVDFDEHKKYQKCNAAYKCSKCEYITNTKTELDTHILIHKSEKPHKCNECKFAFHRSSDLRRHIMTHTGEKPFKCTQCNYATSRSHQLRVHRTIRHNAKMYSCSKCEHNCKSVMDLKNHQITCFIEKSFTCHLCNYTSKKKAYLNKHLKKHIKSFKCNLCDYGCTKYYELKSHMSKIHPRKVSNSHVRKYSNAKNCKSLKKKHKQK